MSVPDELIPFGDVSRPGWDAVGTRSASAPSEGGQTAIASPRPDVIGTRDGTRSLSDGFEGSEPTPFVVVDARSFAFEDEPGADPLLGAEGVGVLVGEDADVMIYGKGGAGKTTLAVDLAFYLAAGEPWLGVPVPRRARVALIENEGPRPLFRRKLRRRFEAWETSGGLDLAGYLFQLSEPWASVSLDRAGDRARLAALVAEYALDVVVIGPLTRSGMNEAGTLQHVRDYVALCAEVRRLAGRRVTFVLIHHENRAGSVSGAWEGAVDTLLHVQGAGNGHTRLYVEKARWGSTYHERTLRLTWAEGETFELADDDERDDNAIADDVLGYVLENGGTGWNRVDEAVAGKGERLRAIRAALLASGRLVNAGTESRMRLWHVDDPACPSAQGELGTTEGGD